MIVNEYQCYWIKNYLAIISNITIQYWLKISFYDLYNILKV